MLSSHPPSSPWWDGPALLLPSSLQRRLFSCTSANYLPRESVSPTLCSWSLLTLYRPGWPGLRRLPASAWVQGLKGFAITPGSWLGLWMHFFKTRLSFLWEDLMVLSSVCSRVSVVPMLASILKFYFCLLSAGDLFCRCEHACMWKPNDSFVDQFLHLYVSLVIWWRLSGLHDRHCCLRNHRTSPPACISDILISCN